MSLARGVLSVDQVLCVVLGDRGLVPYLDVCLDLELIGPVGLLGHLGGSVLNLDYLWMDLPIAASWGCY